MPSAAPQPLLSPTTKLIVGVVVGFVLLLILWPFKVIRSDERGLVFKFGAIQPQTLDNGLHWRTPIMTKIRTVSIRPIQVEHKIEVGKDGAITKDNQTIGADMSVFYKYSSDRLVEMWSRYGEEKVEALVLQTLRESFKSEIGKLDIFSIPLKQDEIRSATLESVKARLAQYPIEVTDLKVVNYDWSDEFDKQIQATMARAQQVKQAEQELLITEQEAQKKVKQAEADKEALVKSAEGDRDAAKLRAEAKALEGEGLRRFNEEVAKNMEMELKLRALEIEKLRVEKWNGQYVPTNNYGPIPFQTGSVQK